jgi:hypothetical protein
VSPNLQQFKQLERLRLTGKGRDARAGIVTKGCTFDTPNRTKQERMELARYGRAFAEPFDTPPRFRFGSRFPITPLFARDGSYKPDGVQLDNLPQRATRVQERALHADSVRRPRITTASVATVH